MSAGARIVIDTNVLISAALRPHAVPWQVFDRVLSAGRLATCGRALAELERVLLRQKLDRFATRERRAALLGAIRAHGISVVVEARHFLMAQGACRDPDDELFLALALAANAAAIVSGDADLLTLGAWHGIPICTPAQYLERIA